jgi:hypothetical protein
MRANLLEEPEMQFGRGQHIDPRFGLLEFGPADLAAEAAPRNVPVGVVGTPETIEGVQRWLKRCQRQIAPVADSRHPNYHPPFPGFCGDAGFESALTFDARLRRSVANRDLRDLSSVKDRGERLHAAKEVLLDQIEAVAEQGLARVILVCPPIELLALTRAERSEMPTRSRSPLGPPELHDVVKAAALRLGVPLQFVRLATYDETKVRKQADATGQPATQQDDATKAWNIHTALYYKAGGFPWSLIRDPRALDSCFIGISFYFEAGGALATSTAQVFDERGEGVIVRGGPAKLTKNDRHPYLAHDDAERLLLDALKRYRAEHRRLPARVVIHKTAPFRGEEVQGLQAAADEERITDLELVAIGPSSTRFSARKTPPLRGTQVLLDERHQSIYTSGAVPFYEHYPGPYVPQPLSVFLQQSEQSAEQHGTEILALTKLNWNNSRLDGRDPITIGAARRIGSILRYVPPEGAVGSRYAFYM